MLHLGEAVLVRIDKIIAIISGEGMRQKDTINCLRRLQRQGNTIDIAADLGLKRKAAVLVEQGGKVNIYYSPISPATLIKRANAGDRFRA